jgi:hypothetical protein
METGVEDGVTLVKKNQKSKVKSKINRQQFN